MSDVRVPVLIVGGGGAGLTASMLLSTMGVESLLVSSLPTTSTLPKAHILNQRAMEIMSDTGVADEIYAVGTPPEQFAYTAVYAGFSGHGNAGRRLAKIECWGNGGRDLEWVAASPLLSTNLPQIRLEPILRRRAEELAPGRVRFHHELTAFVQDADGVSATIADLDNGTEYTVRADYMIACDGGRTVGRILGVEMQGVRRFASQVSIHLSTDFSKLAVDDDVLIRWHYIPEISAMVVMVPMGPSKWGTESPEWSCTSITRPTIRARSMTARSNRTCVTHSGSATIRSRSTRSPTGRRKASWPTGLRMVACSSAVMRRTSTHPPVDWD